MIAQFVLFVFTMSASESMVDFETPMMSAPKRAKPIAIAFPMPLEHPVTMAVLLLRSKIRPDDSNT